MSESGIREIFLGEAAEIFHNLESDIILLEEKGCDHEIINRIFRCVHTLKGSSGIAGFDRVYEFTHRLESLLDNVRCDKLDVDEKVIDLILTSVDWIKDELMNDERDMGRADRVRESLLQRIDEFMGGRTCDDSPGESAGKLSEIDRTFEAGHGGRYYRVALSFRNDIFTSGIDPLMIIEDLLALGTLVVKRVDKSSLPPFDRFDPESCYLKWQLVLRSDHAINEIKDVFLFVADDNDIEISDITAQYRKVDADGVVLQEKKVGEILVEQGVISPDDLEEAITVQESTNRKIGEVIVGKGLASEHQVEDALRDQERIKKRIEVSTVRVDTARLDGILNLLGEIVIGQAALSGIAELLGEDSEIGSQLKNALFALDRTTREFQEQIMSIRMVPIGPTFEQFRRFVRDSAHAMDKEISLMIEGGETELDKTVIEKIGDPLKHMIRNSIDHGIESAQERRAAGKDQKGRVLMRAYHQEGNVFIEIADDGRGIDLEKVRIKAENRGLVRPDEDVPADRLYSYLFHPGFSTAESIGDLSGRGVGMDVVKTNIEELRGSVEIRSEKGKGTVVRIKLPLTLAIIDGMLISIGDNIFIIPLLSVIESIQPRREDIKTVEGRGEVILVRGEYVSLIRMYRAFGLEARHDNPWEALVVIAESGGTRVGLMIDDLLGQQQIVIKSLDSHITESRAISGAAILGDGKVALIVDIHGLLEDVNIH
jgi:two-component system chemotaxis sensor kinase CheA